MGSKNLGVDVARAYILHTGSIAVTAQAIREFRLAHDVLQKYSDSEIQDIVTANMDAAHDEVNPYVDMDLIFRCMSTVDHDMINFRRIAGQVRSQNFEEMLNLFPLSSSNRRRLLEAKKLIDSKDTIYKTSEEAPNPAIDAGSTPMPEAPAVMPDAGAPAPDAPTDTPLEGEVPVNGLDPKMTEKVVFTIGDFLEKNVFQSKVTPQVAIDTAAKLKGGKDFVLKISFTSTDGSAKAFAYALFKNNKVQMPAEFFKEEAEGEKTHEVKLGDFIPEAIKDYFSYKPEAQEPEQGKGYDYLISCLINPNSTPMVRTSILNTILKKYGTDAAKKAFDTYTVVLFKQPENPLVIESNKRVNLREV